MSLTPKSLEKSRFGVGSAPGALRGSLVPGGSILRPGSWKESGQCSSQRPLSARSDSTRSVRGGARSGRPLPSFGPAEDSGKCGSWWAAGAGCFARPPDLAGPRFYPAV